MLLTSMKLWCGGTLHLDVNTWHNTSSLGTPARLSTARKAAAAAAPVVVALPLSLVVQIVEKDNGRHEGGALEALQQAETERVHSSQSSRAGDRRTERGAETAAGSFCELSMVHRGVARFAEKYGET
jgi:hypothetical protein